MQDTAIRRPPGPAADSDTVALAFSDADGAKRWAKGLPLLPVAQGYDALLGQLRAMAAADWSARERATIAEVFREPVAHLHTELARRYAGKPQPLADREQEAFAQAQALWQALWEQYSACLKPLLEGDADLAGVKAKLLQRGLFVGRELVLVHALARRAPPATLWQELHAYYRIAEMLDATVQAVSDDLATHGVGISCYSTYLHALLFDLADPYSLRVREIEIVDRWLAQWARKVFPYAQQRETEGPVMVVDLDGSAGARLVPAAPADPPASMRFGYPAKLATSVRGRLKRLAAGASPAELQLGQDVSTEQCVALLSHLDAHWHQLRREPPRTRTSVELCAGGLPGVYFRIGGRTFDRQDPLGRLTYHGAQHLSTLGAVTDYDRYREAAERDWPWERWDGEYEWRDASLLRAGAGRHRWFLEQVVSVRDGERTRVGYVTRVAQSASGELALSLRLYPGTPRAIAVRPAQSAFSEDPPMPVVELAATPEEPAELLLPPRSFAAGRLLRTMVAGPERRFRLTRLLQRGADFERVAFELAA